VVAVQDKAVSFVVLLAAPALRGNELFILQSALIAKAYGAPDDYISRRRIFDQKLYAAIVAAPTEQESLHRAQALTELGVAEKIVEPAEAASLPQDKTNPWMRYFLAYDPAPTLRTVTVPILALYGSLDLQVPAKENAAVIREALNNNEDATILELPGLNHIFQAARTGSPAEYGEIEETFSSGALEIITDWVVVQR
jgi:uncharacterized protein